MLFCLILIIAAYDDDDDDEVYEMHTYIFHIYYILYTRTQKYIISYKVKI